MEQVPRNALRGHEERAKLLRRMPDDAKETNRPAFAAQLEEIVEVKRDVDAIRSLWSSATMRSSLNSLPEDEKSSVIDRATKASEITFPWHLRASTPRTCIWQECSSSKINT
ncbi:MAG: hypothetical protein ACREPY_15335 [Rhodanobacteraceae bacterium]